MKMRSFLVSVLLFVAFCSPSGAAETDDPRARLAEPGAVQRMIAEVGAPEWIKRLAADYEAVIRPEAYRTVSGVSQGNAGLNAYIREQLGHDDSLGLAAWEFYREIGEIDRVRSAKSRDDRRAFPLGARASLGEVSGDARNPSLEPGWLWKLALRHAGGNPSRAIKLIAICGHDDINQGSIPLRFPESMRARLYELRTASMDREIRRLEGLGENGSELLPQVRAYREAMTPESISLSGGLTCPRKDSALYLRQALGKDYDLGKTLRKKIILAQAPGDLSAHLQGVREPGASLPAKSYHMYGAALIACQLIEDRGRNPMLVATLAGPLGYLYRSVRATGQAMEAGQSDPTAGADLPSIADEEMDAEHSRFLARPNSSKYAALGLAYITHGGKDPLAGIDRPSRAQFETAVRQVQAGVHGIFASRNERQATERDAFELMRRWTLSDREIHWGAHSLRLPYNDIGPKVPTFLEGTVVERLIHPKPEGWTDERFAKARTKYKSMIIDWQWSASQESAGGKLAARNCVNPQTDAAAVSDRTESHPQLAIDGFPGLAPGTANANDAR